MSYCPILEVVALIALSILKSFFYLFLCVQSTGYLCD